VLSVLGWLVLFENQNAGPYFSFLTFSLPASALKRATFYYMNIQIFQSKDVVLTCLFFLYPEPENSINNKVALFSAGKKVS